MTLQNSNKIPGAIVAIGGSAGALEAFEHFFKSVPEDVDAAFVVLQHMDPNQKSLLAELLGRMSKLPVEQAKQDEVLQSRHVYVIEPGTTLELLDNRFVIYKSMNLEERRYPIDHFFASLATQYGTRSVGIVVSGTGTDGTQGLRLIQAAGGRTLVQKPSEAKFNGMPESAIVAGVVDFVLPIKEIAEALSSFKECDRLAAFEHELEQENFKGLDVVCEVLFKTTGHDFSSYRKSTVARRVERRLQANLIPSLSAYAEFLKTNPEEPRALLKDLLISVTHFFRDPIAFEALRKRVIPALFGQVHPGEAIRVWVPACATGEEAYTIAILLKEYQREHRPNTPLQIFATDIDRAGLEFARGGVYPLSIVAQVPASYLARYFKKFETGYQAAQELREICIFSEHSLLKNPPFSRLDLISCRNLFIYWEPELQSKVIPLFHYALKPSGFLFLGPAENISGTAELFKALDQKSRIFKRLGVISRNHLYFPVSSLVPRAPNSPEIAQSSAFVGDRDVGKAITSTLLENFAPPAFVISEHGDIAFYSGKTGKYLEPPTGVPNNNLFDIISRTLRSELHALLHRCIKTKNESSRSGVSFEKNGIVQYLKITVKPMGDFTVDLGFYLVILQEIATAPNLSLSSESTSSPQGAQQGAQQSPQLELNPQFMQLEEELRNTREHLQSTIEEVKSSNEELLSMNEELQSANEELQTSKEELQSTNEELENVNSEISKKVDELDSSNSDLQNFFQGSQVPILFLDRDFRIQKFTPAATRIFRLIPTDLGRGISDITSFLETADFTSSFTQVLETLQPLEREIRTKEKSLWYLMRVSPYRTVGNLIAGIVVTFSDVTDLKKAQETKSTLAAIVDSSADAIISRDLDMCFTSWNAGAEKLLLFSADEAIGKPNSLIVPPDKLAEFRSLEEKALTGEAVQGVDTERVRKDGSRFAVSMTMSSIRDELGVNTGTSVILRDITERKKSEETIQRSNEQLVDVLESMGDGFFSLDRDWNFVRVNSVQERVSQTQRSETLGKNFWEVFPATKIGKYWANYHRVMNERVPSSFEEFYSPLGIWTEVDAYPTKDGGIAVFFRDVTTKKKSEQEAIAAHEQFAALADAMPNLAWIAQADGFITWYNQKWYEYTGKISQEMEGWGWQSVHDPVELPRVLENWKASIETGRPFEMTFPLKGADGVFRWFLTRVNPLKDAQGKILRWFGTNTDVDEQKRAREALKQSEERLRLALVAAKMGTFDWCKVSGALVWSDQMAKLHGLSPGQFLGTFEHARELTHPEDHPKVIQEIEQSFRTGDIFEVEYRVIWPKDQSVHWLYVYGQTMKEAQGKPVRSVGTVMDITERKRIENELREAVQTRDEFLSIASHELKTPLTSLGIQAQMRKRALLKQDPSTFTLERLSKMIEGDERQINRLTRLIDDMLDIARISSGQLTVNPEPVDLGVTVREVADRFSEQLALAHCKLSIEQLDLICGEWDRFRIEQVITNLITNAIKYGPGKPIHIQTFLRKGNACVVIRDEGMGISQKDQERIFKQFERAITKNEVSGLGLGLYIVKQILAVHGGAIRVESELGKGSEFIVELPLTIPK